MKKQIILLSFLMLSCCSFAIAQSTNNIKQSDAYKNSKMVYDLAARYNDINVAKDALYQLISIDPGDLSLRDSLAYLYLDTQKYPSCILVCNDILQMSSTHQSALEMAAIAYENLNIRDKALEHYESLYLQNNNPLTLYKMAFLQYELKRYGESETTIDILLNEKGLEEQSVVYNLENNQQQEIPIKASIHNLKGMLEKDRGNADVAKENFEKALEIAPEFHLAKQNVEEIKE